MSHRCLTFFIAAWFMTVVSVYADDDITVVVNEVDSSSAPAAQQMVVPIEDVIRKLTENAPELVINRNDREIDVIISSFLKGFECDINYIKAANIDKAKTANSKQLKYKAPVYPVIKLDHNKILYIRFDSFSPDASESIFKKLKQISLEDKKNLSGVVVDLRQCHGYNINEALRMLYLMCPESRLPALKDPAPRLLKKPVAVLVCGGTSGSAEFFARMVKVSKTGLTIGMTTVGKPFESKFIKLKNGDYLSIPKFPAGIRSFKVFPVKPMIPVACPRNFVSDFRKLKKSGKLSDDPQLRRACDLLVSLSALKFDFSAKKK